MNLADAAQALRDVGLLDSPLGSNAWAFGKDVTANGSGMLLGNPHFPWSGPNRFYEMHLTIPGQMDVMGGGIGTYTLDATQGSYWLTNARLGIRTADKRHELAVFANNLFNQRYFTNGSAQGFGRELRWGEPRIIGVEARLSY